MTKTIALSMLLAAGFAASASAEAIRFDFEDPKGVNNVVFLLDAPLESINGTATGISGVVHYDPENPGSTEGSILLDAKSLHVGNSRMKEHLHGERWLDSKTHAEIAFHLHALEQPQSDGDAVQGIARGELTLKGVTREIEVPVSITYLKDKLGMRMSGAEGDLLVIRSNFSVKRSDYGINAGEMEDRVSNLVELRLSLAGMAPR